MKLNLISVLWTLAALMAAPCVLAEKADRNKPMNIEADALRHDDPQKLTTFTGNVMMSKGSLVLRAARMEVRQDSQGHQNAKLWAATGERVFFRQKREGLDEYTEGEGEIVEYNSQADTMTLNTRAELRLLRGSVVADRIQGHLIVFNNTSEVFTVDGKPGATGNAGQRVKATNSPRAKPLDANPPAATPALKSSPSLSNPKP